jgi:signal transduction histidine kinase
MPGSGLGLTIVNDLVSAYGGTVELGVAEVLGGLSVRIMVPNTLTPGGAGGEGRNL